jgi:hypothetical protein
MLDSGLIQASQSALSKKERIEKEETVSGRNAMQQLLVVKSVSQGCNSGTW